MTTTATIEVEPDGKVIRGLLIPYDEPAICASSGPDGELLIYKETFDHNSIPEFPPGKVPLLLSHDESRPIGNVLRLWHTPDGLNVEAELVASDPDLDGIRRRAEAGVMSSLSVGFMADKNADVWTAPTGVGGLPTVRRRGVVVREASVCVWPAYASASVRGIHQRTRAQQRLHEQSEAVLAQHDQAQLVTRTAAGLLDRLTDTQVSVEPPTPARPRQPIQPPPIPYGDGRTMPAAPELPWPNPTDHERQLHERALQDWANELNHLDHIYRHRWHYR